MSETPHQKPEQKSPFSPLQSGCAIVMLTNMVIYLGVVAFVFNLLDPSKIDETYLAKRGFAARPEKESDQDKEFRQISENKRQEQQESQPEVLDSSRAQATRLETPAMKMSRLEETPLASSRINQPELPKAALTRSALRTAGGVRSAKSRLFSVSIYPQASLRNSYSPYRIPTPQTITPEEYQTFPVQIAPGIDFPTFTLPTAETEGSYLYKPPSPVPEATHGGPRITAPAVGAESLYTNRPSQETEKDHP